MEFFPPHSGRGFGIMFILTGSIYYVCESRGSLCLEALFTGGSA